MSIHIGTAGWAIPAQARDHFAAEGTALERYASVFDAVEINSSFHRRHRPDTWANWAAATPDAFRFAVKLPKTITHGAKLRDVDGLVEEFAGDVAGLSGKLGVVLVQLPPSLAFDPALVAPFFDHLAKRVPAQLACEPRHPSWFEPEADAALTGLKVARVAADPALVPLAAVPGGDCNLTYWRLHGSPQMYRSAYGRERMTRLLAAIEPHRGIARPWCMFDNTASSAAIDDALLLHDLAEEPRA